MGLPHATLCVPRSSRQPAVVFGTRRRRGKDSLGHSSSPRSPQTDRRPASETAVAQSRRGCASLDSVGLAGRAHHLPTGLSRDQQQRVGIVQTPVEGPRAPFTDEPTRSLDVDRRRQPLHRRFVSTFHAAWVSAPSTPLAVAVHMRFILATVWAASTPHADRLSPLPGRPRPLIMS